MKKTLAFTDGLSSQHDPHKISWKVFDYVGKHASGVPASCIFVLLHAWTTPHVPSDLLLQKFAGYSLVFFLDFLPGQVEMHHYSVYNLAQTQTLRRTHTSTFSKQKNDQFFLHPSRSLACCESSSADSFLFFLLLRCFCFSFRSAFSSSVNGGFQFLG